MVLKMYLSFYGILLLIPFCHGNDIYVNIMERLAALEQKDSELAFQLQAKDATIERLSTEVKDLKARVVHLESAIASPKEPSEEDLLVEKTDDPLSSSQAKRHSRFDHTSNLDNPSERHVLNARKIKPLSLHVPSNRIVRQLEIVAFHAVTDKGEIPNIGVNQNIVFETVLLNLGNGYHQQHGVFIAPTTGLYIFSASVLSFNNNQVFDVNIVKNGSVLARIYGYGTAGYHDQGSATVITQLNAADEVWLKLECCANESLYGGRYTTFTGAMLFAV